MADRFVWTVKDVCDATGPEVLYRNYLEQRDVRTIIRETMTTPVGVACDVGCGFGRMTGLLAECARRTIGLEREAGLLEYAGRLVEGAAFVQVASLTALPLGSAVCDLAMCFTVLQHLPDAAAHGAARELTRILAPNGWLLLAEETDPDLEAGGARHAEMGYTRGRPVTLYEAWLAPLRLVRVQPRRVESTYPRPDVGTYMLWRRSPGS